MIAFGAPGGYAGDEPIMAVTGIADGPQAQPPHGHGACGSDSVSHVRAILEGAQCHVVIEAVILMKNKSSEVITYPRALSDWRDFYLSPADNTPMPPKDKAVREFFHEDKEALFGRNKSLTEMRCRACVRDAVAHIQARETAAAVLYIAFLPGSTVPVARSEPEIEKEGASTFL
jgi:hypothetical protein